METLLAIICVLLIALMAYREYLSSKERADMLDRLMAKDSLDYNMNKSVKSAAPVTENEDELGEEDDPNLVRLDSIEAIESILNAEDNATLR